MSINIGVIESMCRGAGDRYEGKDAELMRGAATEHHEGDVDHAPTPDSEVLQHLGANIGNVCLVGAVAK